MNTTSYYVDGNTVRKTDAAEEGHRRRQRAQRQAQQRQQKQYRQQRQSEPRTVRYQEAEKTASVSLTLPATILLVAAVAASVFIGYRYLCIKSSLDAHMNNIKTLESTLDTLRTENDALEKSIDTSVDLNAVYETATGSLGMVRVGQDNTIQYDKTESEYVKQYEDIPSGN